MSVIFSQQVLQQIA